MNTQKELTIGEKRDKIYELFMPQNNSVLLRLLAYTDRKYNDFFKTGIYCTSLDIFYESICQILYQTERHWDTLKYPNAVSQIIFVFLSNLRNIYKKEFTGSKTKKEEKNLYEKKLSELEPCEKELIIEIFGDENFDPKIVDQAKVQIPFHSNTSITEMSDYSNCNKSEAVKLVERFDKNASDDFIQRINDKKMYDVIIGHFNIHGSENQKNVLEGMYHELTEKEIALKYNLTPKRVNKIKEQIRSISNQLFITDDEVSSAYKVKSINLSRSAKAGSKVSGYIEGVLDCNPDKMNKVNEQI